jgi:hypothetical protein
MSARSDLQDDRNANTQAGQPIGAEDTHATVADGPGASDEARLVPDGLTGFRAEFMHPRTSPLPPDEQSAASEKMAEAGKAATPMDEVTAGVVEVQPRPSVWEATGLKDRTAAEDEANDSPDEQ